jgi:hypothetical protein
MNVEAKGTMLDNKTARAVHLRVPFVTVLNPNILATPARRHPAHIRRRRRPWTR